MVTGAGLGMIINGWLSELYTLASMTCSPRLRSTGTAGGTEQNSTAAPAGSGRG